MFEVRQSGAFSDWLNGLRDRKAQERIAIRLVRLAAGLFGDAKSVGGGVSELRIDHGPGYRLYYARKDNIVVVLLCGGDKSTQSRDVLLAKAMAKDL